MHTLIQDLRYAFRQLRRRPGFAAATVATIAIGVGGTAAIFSMVNALLLRPLPVAEPDRLVVVQETRENFQYFSNGHTGFPLSRYRELQPATAEIFAGLAAHVGMEMSLRTGDEAEALAGTLVSENYFEVLGVRPAAGRFFGPGEGHSPLAVISHAVWTSRFGGDPDVVGRGVHLNGQDFTVVGVAERGFDGAFFERAGVWVPVEGYGGPPPVVMLFGRLLPGVEREQTAAALTPIAQQVPFDGVTVLRADVEPLRTLVGDARGLAFGVVGVLLAVSILVLLVASANVGGMLLARAAARRREVAIRQAVGAGRGRLVRQLLTENLLNFVLGGLAGLLLALWLTHLLEGFTAALAMDLSLDLRVVAFALAAVVASGILFGLVPAFQGTRTGVGSALKEGASPPAARSRLRGAFVVAQFAVTVILLVVSGLLVRTLQGALRADVGFEIEGLVFAGVNPGAHGYDRERADIFFRELLERAEAHPSIAAASLVRYVPMAGTVSSSTATVEGPEGTLEFEAQTGDIGPGYFETVGMALQAGRGFTEAEAWDGGAGVVVNETLARRAWPGGNALGQRIRVRGAEREVIGVARDSRYEMVTEAATPPYVYFSAGARFGEKMMVVARGRADPPATVAALREVLRAVDANVALENPMTGREVMDESLLPQRIAGVLIGIFGVVGLVLAGIGIFGVLLFHVGQRTREIGVRLALGARSTQVRGLVVRQGMLLAGIGAVVGLAISAAASQVVAGMLYGVSPLDPLTFISVPLLLIAVALAAAYLPARRASRVDPMVALRSE